MSQRDVRLPPMNSLRVFEAAARRLSFSRAADDLMLTQAAVSKQIRNLEDHFGRRLFNREPNGLELTEAGVILTGFVDRAMESLRDGSLQVRRIAKRRSVAISTVPSLATKWLVPLMSSMPEELRDVEIRVICSYETVNFSARPDIDFAIRYTDAPSADHYSEHLLTETLFPVCTPDLLGDTQPDDYLDFIRSTPTIGTGGHYEQWGYWADKNETTWEKEHVDLFFSDPLPALAAAKQGLGVALARNALVDQDLEEGRLVALKPLSAPSKYSYWIICPREPQERDDALVVIQWLRQASLSIEIDDHQPQPS